jgi:hypothetical protein
VTFLLPSATWPSPRSDSSGFISLLCHPSLLLSQNLGLVCFLLILLPATVWELITWPRTCSVTPFITAATGHWLVFIHYVCGVWGVCVTPACMHTHGPGDLVMHFSLVHDQVVWVKSQEEPAKTHVFNVWLTPHLGVQTGLPQPGIFQRSLPQSQKPETNQRFISTSLSKWMTIAVYK